MRKWPIHEVLNAFILEFDRHEDQRGYFEEIYSTGRDYPHLAGTERQINLSHSKKGVVRGMHIAPFAKICSCIRGKLFDVIADVRPGSPTYLKWFGMWLDEYSNKQIYVPAGCAHGFFAAEDDTILLYLQDGIYNPKAEQQVNWRDPKLNIKWPYSQPYILSEKDRKADFLS